MLMWISLIIFNELKHHIYTRALLYFLKPNVYNRESFFLYIKTHLRAFVIIFLHLRAFVIKTYDII